MAGWRGQASQRGSGKPAELMAAAGIDADAIVAAVRKLVAVSTPA